MGHGNTVGGLGWQLRLCPELPTASKDIQHLHHSDGLNRKTQNKNHHTEITSEALPAS